VLNIANLGVVLVVLTAFGQAPLQHRHDSISNPGQAHGILHHVDVDAGKLSETTGQTLTTTHPWSDASTLDWFASDIVKINKVVCGLPEKAFVFDLSHDIALVGIVLDESYAPPALNYSDSRGPPV